MKVIEERGDMQLVQGFEGGRMVRRWISKTAKPAKTKAAKKKAARKTTKKS